MFVRHVKLLSSNTLKSACKVFWQTPAHLLSEDQPKKLPWNAVFSHALSFFENNSVDGPNRLKVRAIPFKVSEEEAIAAYEGYHNKQALLWKTAADNYNVKGTYLPFWVGDVKATTALHSASIGFRYTATVYNPGTRRMETHTGTT